MIWDGKPTTTRHLLATARANDHDRDEDDRAVFEEMREYENWRTAKLADDPSTPPRELTIDAWSNELVERQEGSIEEALNAGTWGCAHTQRRGER